MIAQQPPRSPHVGTRMTLDEYLALPGDKPYLEYQLGVVTQKRSPNFAHGALAFRIGAVIETATDPSAHVIIAVEARLVSGGFARLPDLSATLTDRIPTDVDGAILHQASVPADVVVEILSPGQTLDAMLERCRWFIGEGVGAAILVDPSEHAAYLITGSSAADATGPLTRASVLDLRRYLPGCRFTVDEVFAVLRLH